MTINHCIIFVFTFIINFFTYCLTQWNQNCKRSSWNWTTTSKRPPPYSTLYHLRKYYPTKIFIAIEQPCRSWSLSVSHLHYSSLCRTFR